MQLKAIIYFLLFFLYNSLNAKSQELDSLLHIFNNSKNKVEKLDALNEISWIYLLQNSDSTLYYANLQLDLAKQIKNEKREASAYLNLGSYYLNISNKEKSLENYFNAIKIFKKNNLQKNLSIAYGNIGLVYYANSDFINAIDYQYKCLKIKESLKDEKGVAKAFLDIGNIYYELKQTENAIKCFEKSISIFKKLNLADQEANVYVGLGLIYNDAKQYDKAIFIYNKSIDLFKTIKDMQGLSNAYSNLALVYYEQKKYDKAIELNKISLAIDTEIDNVRGVIISLLNLADIYKTINNKKEVHNILNSLDPLFEQFDNSLIKKDYYDFKYWLAKQEGNYKLALDYFEQAKLLSDSILKEENNKEIIQKQFKYEYEKKSESDSLRVAEEKKVTDLQLKQEKTQRFALYGGLALVAIFAVFMYNRFRVTNKQKQIIELKEKETQQQKHIIEEKHKEITDSINYAERIQRSFLATKELLDENLSDYFVLFQPKDVVSGDFYWATKLGNGNFALVTADSTGHGVPGAIMSLLNITSLESAIKDGYTQPAEILNATRKTIIERLKKDGSAEGGKDGMDCSLTVYDFKQNKLFVTAANNPVWIIRPCHSEQSEESNLRDASFVSMTKYEVIEIKPDKMPVGKHDKQDVLFTQHEIDLQNGDVVYTLTDGFPDQFGGESGKKFMSKKLRELLLANANLPMEEQKELLQTTFKNWVGELEQVDDVCVIGVRV